MSARLSIKDFKPGDLLVITSRYRVGDSTIEEHRAAQVSCVNYSKGLVAYTPPDVRSDHYAEVFGPHVTMDTGSGAFNPAEYDDEGARLDLDTKPYGLTIKVHKVGYRKPWEPWSPKPGDRGYDLLQENEHGHH